VTLRTKLLLAQAPLALVLGLLGVASVGTVSVLGRQSERILADNYRSVLAAQRMKEALERLDSAAIFRVAGRADKAAPMEAPNRARFEQELSIQEHNITEPGEAEATEKLRALWTKYKAQLDEFRQISSAEERSATYFDRLQPTFALVKDAADFVLDLNQDAMVRKSEQAQRAARRQNTTLIAATLGALLVGVLSSIWLTSRLLRPLAVLTQAVRSIGAGDLDARAIVSGKDEIAILAAEFNAMTLSLRDYRRSSLGELLQAQQAAQAAIDSLPDPVIVLANDGSVSNVNVAGETLLNIKAGSSADPLASLDPALREALINVRAHVIGGRGALVPKGLEDAVRIDPPEGPRFLLPRASPVYSEEGSVVGASIVLQDVTRLMRFDELRNDLVATVAHEFRTPLTSLRLALHMVLEEVAGPLGEKQAELLYTARGDCERLQSIVDDLLDLTKMRAGRVEVETVSISSKTLVDAAVNEKQGQAQAAGVQLAVRFEEPILPVQADPERVSLVLTNLIANALRHSPAGSTVTIATLPSGSSVRFEVVDEGQGIAKEFLDRVFEKFFRIPGTRGEGIGLGLYISREIVQAHGGEMGLQSEPGKGSRFWFSLPLASAELNRDI
jgi:NtrC-family two-component system sensor histidine kinase KinB